MRIELPYTPPIQWDRLLRFLGARAAPSVELTEGDEYARTVCVGGRVGVVRVMRPHDLALAHLVLSTSESLDEVVDETAARVRQLFDLDADTAAIEKHLADEGLAARDRLRAGLRVPGAFDAYELAIRAVLGQQVSVKGASTLMTRFTARFGTPVETGHAALTHLAATADRVASASVEEIRAIGIPGARAETIHSLSGAIASGAVVLEPGGDATAVMETLMRIRGIGPWTAGYVAMRALRWADAFPASDLVLRRSAGASTAAALLRRAERWRPWRSYAAMQLWSGVNDAA